MRWRDRSRRMVSSGNRKKWRCSCTMRNSRGVWFVSVNIRMVRRRRNVTWIMLNTVEVSWILDFMHRGRWDLWQLSFSIRLCTDLCWVGRPVADEVFHSKSLNIDGTSDCPGCVRSMCPNCTFEDADRHTQLCHAFRWDDARLLLRVVILFSDAEANPCCSNASYDKYGGIYCAAKRLSSAFCVVACNAPCGPFIWGRELSQS